MGTNFSQGPARPLSLCILMAASLGASVASPASASSKSVPISELVIDAGTGRTIFASDADRNRPPASLAKLMTVLLAFDALDHGKLRLSDRVIMTAAGERQPPSRLGLASRHSLSLKDALQAIAVISANDVAVALAEQIAGSETRFVDMMNRRAGQIGMAHTRFGNATGLAPGAGMTTARDLATLSRYIIRRYPSRYSLFSTRSITWDGRVRRNHNQLLGNVKGLDGLKTGYTAQAGFNLAASGRRNGTRIIVIVMGARTAPARDLLVSNLLESGFTSPKLRPSRR